MKTKKKAGKKALSWVAVSGGFDPIHIGHVRRRAALRVHQFQTGVRPRCAPRVESLQESKKMPTIPTNSGLRDNHTRGIVADFLRAKIQDGSRLSVVSAYFTIYAYDALKATRLAAARAALDAPAPDPVVVESVDAFMRRIDQFQRLRCPHCGKGQFVPTAPIAAVPLPLLHLRGPP